MEIFESEGDLLAVGDASYREVEPGLVVVALHDADVHDYIVDVLWS